MRWNEHITFTKDPADILDYIMDFSPLLKDDAIATTTVESKNVIIDSDLTTGNVVTIFVSGGTSGLNSLRSSGGRSNASVSTKITTTGGRTYERSFRLLVEDL